MPGCYAFGRVHNCGSQLRVGLVRAIVVSGRGPWLREQRPDDGALPRPFAAMDNKCTAARSRGLSESSEDEYVGPQRLKRGILHSEGLQETVSVPLDTGT